MLKKVLFPIWFLIIILGCEGAQKNDWKEQEPENLTQSNLDNDSKVGRVSLEEEKVGLEEEKESEEGPSGPVTASWVDFDTKGASGVMSLILRVENISHFPVTVRAEFFCDAFIGKSKSVLMDPKEQSIPIGGEALFKIAANKFPLQVLDGAGSFRAKVYVALDGAIVDGKPVEKRVYATQMYYRHNAGYNTIDIFDTEGLIKRNEGILANKAAAANATVGRILEDNNTFSEIRGNGLRVNAVDKDGKVNGTIDGLSIEFESIK